MLLNVMYLLLCIDCEICLFWVENELFELFYVCFNWFKFFKVNVSVVFVL